MPHNDCYNDGLYFFLGMSYSWCSPGHPDEAGFHLQRLATILKGLLSEPIICSEAGVFWDFMSVFQQKRSPVEDALFKAAMHSMQLVYSHDAVMVLKMIAMPPCPYPLDANRQYDAVVRGKPRELAWDYEDRGWPWFESNVRASTS